MHNRAHKYLSIGGLILIIAFLITACSSAVDQTETARMSPLLTTENKAPLPTDPPPAPLAAQKLRITNQSPHSIQNLVVRFPEDRVDFGKVPAGATTDYQVIPHGVYRYAAYDVEVDGRKYQQPVIDWVGENPMEGKAFTYILEVDPSRWETEGQVIILVRVSVD